MSTNKLFAVLIVCGLMFVGAAMMTSNMRQIEQEDNAFAKDCNDRGGVAKFGYSVRQCIGAKQLEPPHGR